jgi:hypothetical protein
MGLLGYLIEAPRNGGGFFRVYVSGKRRDLGSRDVRSIRITLTWEEQCGMVDTQKEDANMSLILD